MPYDTTVMRHAIPIIAAVLSSPGIFAQAVVEPWAVRLGDRADATLQSIPVIDRVVLVPDQATYLDEIARWSPDGQWPVLIADDRYAPLFVRAFNPKQVLRRESVGRRRITPLQIDEVVLRAWGGAPGTDDLKSAFARRSHEPQGVVVSSANDPARVAAVALAAGRGQPIIWHEGKFGLPNQAMPQEDADRLLKALYHAIGQLGYPFRELGDTIDAITICRALSARVQVGTGGSTAVLAITDALGRNPDGTRFAITGWIFGNAPYCAYAAMSSLFLTRENVWCVNTYSSAPSYSPIDAALLLSESGYTVKLDQEDNASVDGWLRAIAGGMRSDLLLMNTRGNQTWFEMFRGGRCYSTDVPVLDRPAVVHFIHSWSCTRPAGRATIGAKWLDHGAYALVGAVAEPGLSAFLSPNQIAARITAGVPFLIACRKTSGRIWRVNTHGDPLMTARPQARRERIDPPPGRGRDLREEWTDLIRRADKSRDGQLFADAIELGNLLGEDAAALDLWKTASQRNAAAPAARAILPVLFRTLQHREFMNAWFMLGRPDDNARDMLWHLILPRLDSFRDHNVLLALQSNLRQPLSYADLRRLAPHLMSAFGAGYFTQIVRDELGRTKNASNERELKKLLRSSNR